MTNQMMIATGAKQTPTISQAPKILKAIFKTEPKGMSTSEIVTVVLPKGSVDEETLLLEVGAGNCVPYWKARPLLSSRYGKVGK